MKKRFCVFVIVCISILTITSSATHAQTTTWTDGGGDDLWSSSLNWSNGLPTANDVVFSNAGASSTPGAITSIIDSVSSINSLIFNNTSSYHSLYLQPAIMLNITGGLFINNGAKASLGGNGITAINASYINKGDLTVNSGSILEVTNYFQLGLHDSGALNLAPGAAFHLGTAAAPASMDVAVNVTNDNTTATFAPDSSTNPDISLYISTLNLGVSGGPWGPRPIGTFDLTKYTGPLSIGAVNVGDNRVTYGPQTGGLGHFIFGNSTNNKISFPSLYINQGDVTVNSGSILEVTNYFQLGLHDSGALNLAPGAAFHLGTAAAPASMDVAVNVTNDNTTATFAPDSSTNPDISLYISTLNLGVSGGSWYPNPVGTVDLTKYTGPLSIGTLNIGADRGSSFSVVGTGHFIFGNSVNNLLSFSALYINKGDLTVNASSTLDVTGRIGIGSNGHTDIYVRAISGGIVIENPSASALSLGSGTNRIKLYFNDPNISSTYWGLQWKGDHVAQLNQYLNNQSIIVELTGTRLDIRDLTVSLFKQNGTDYTYIGFDQHTLTVNKTGTGSGTVSGGGTYAFGTSHNITAVADAGSTFTGWSGDYSGSSSPSSVTMLDRAMTCTATFTLNQHTLTVNAAGTGSGTVGGGGTYGYGTSHDVTASAIPGSTFTGWFGDCSGIDSPHSVTMFDRDMTCTATFRINTYALTVMKSGTGNGNVTSSAGSIVWDGSSGSVIYNHGTGVTLTATSDNVSEFVGWSGCDSVTGTYNNLCNITMTAPRSVAATFTAAKTLYFDVANAPDHATSLPAQYGNGAEGLIAATALSAHGVSPSYDCCIEGPGDFIFKGWSTKDGPIDWSKYFEFKITPSAPVSFGSMKYSFFGGLWSNMGGPRGVIVKASRDGFVADETTIRSEGWNLLLTTPYTADCPNDFVDDLSGLGILGAGQTMTIRFYAVYTDYGIIPGGFWNKSPNDYNPSLELVGLEAPYLTVLKSGTGAGTVTSTSPDTSINCGVACSHLYDSESTVTLIAAADTGSSFTGWSGCDSVSGTNNTVCTVAVTRVKSVTASFALCACDDGNVCTTDSCDPVTGNCVHINNALFCDDGNKCTANDVCTNGVCAGMPINCNDNNICTDDTCNPATGCVYTNNALPCSDNNACTENDTCSNGICVPGTPKVCIGNVVCDPLTGCSVTTTGNNLTLLMPSGSILGGTNDVKFTWDGTLQDAATFANGTGQSNATISSDEPLDGYLWYAKRVQVIGPGTYWVDVDGSGPGTNRFEVTIPIGQIGAHMLLDMGPTGQATSCGKTDCDIDVWVAWQSKKAFVTGKLFAGADDGTDTNAPALDDPPVNSVLDGRVNAGTKVWDLVSVDLAGRITNAAGTTIINLPLDGIPGIKMKEGSNANVNVNFNLMLTDVCADAATRCNSNNACIHDSCDPATGQCIHTPVVCNDDNPCTTDLCDPLTGCKYEVKVCPLHMCTDAFCTMQGICVYPAHVCNDNNPCTTDTCSRVTGNCVFTNNTLPCTDNNACTSGDHCSGGACISGTTKTCPSGICSPETGCPVINASTSGNNMTIITPFIVYGGTNDVKFTWDGTLQDVVTFANGTGPSNATITSDEPLDEWLWYAKHVQVVGPGTYWTDLDGAGTSPWRYEVTIPAGRIGAHMLLDLGPTGQATTCGKVDCNVDAWVVWDLNNAFNNAFIPGKMFTGADNGIDYNQSSDDPPVTSLLDGQPNTDARVWDLVSVDVAGRVVTPYGQTYALIRDLPLDKIPGLKLQEGVYKEMSVNFNVMLQQ